MSYFNRKAYEMLLQKARIAGEDDLEIIRDATEDCLHYVQVVCDGENQLNTVVEADRSMVGNYDERRHNAHEDAITSVALLNRFAVQRGLVQIFSGDTAERHQVAEFCAEIADWLFQSRRRVL